MSYEPPIRDLIFSLTDVAGVDRLNETGAFPDFDAETMKAILEAAGTFAAEVLAPLNRSGDRDGARFDNGQVFAPPGFAQAYRAFAEGGWNSLSAPAQYGGQGLPKALEMAVFEFIDSANLAFGLCPVLTQGAIETLVGYGTERQKALYLERLVRGDWPATMHLTEPQAGSDLAQLRTRAEPDGNGKYRLHGQKIFITWGDHDMADNIVHFVLARLPDAPEGTRGISLFLAPKRLVSDDGSLGPANALKPVSVEHKLGIHASPTCVMAYEGAEAELVGTEHQGLAQMFTMMNAARLQVGVQGVAIAERAWQQALAYAQERRQGRSAWTGENPAPIFDHPDIRRMLMLMKAKCEAGRGICLSTAVAADLARHSPEASARDAARLREEFLTPIAKAWCTDVGVEVASMALQIHGGMGFIEETGVAQYYRDARITPIYEGTNGIQAIDLVGRKLALDSGQAMQNLADAIRSCISGLTDSKDKRLDRIAARLEKGVDAVVDASHWLAERRGHPDALAGAVPYLTLCGDVVGGWMLAKGALAALEHIKASGDDGNYWHTKIASAAIYSDHVLTRAPGLSLAATAGADDLSTITPGGFGI